MGERTSLAERRGFDAHVYEAAEDSALLGGSVVDEVESTALVLDVGTGSGFIAGKITEVTGARVIGSEINPFACRRAQANGVEVVRADLTAPFQSGTFDVVTFNPPYLPTQESEWGDWFDVATTGGPSGQGTINRFLDAVGRVLTPRGVVYLLVSTVTGIDSVVEYAGNRGFSATVIDEASYPGEALVVLKLVQ